jgi:hypothetical protein
MRVSCPKLPCLTRLFGVLRTQGVLSNRCARILHESCPTPHTLPSLRIALADERRPTIPTARNPGGIGRPEAPSPDCDERETLLQTTSRHRDTFMVRYHVPDGADVNVEEGTPSEALASGGCAAP